MKNWVKIIFFICSLISFSGVKAQMDSTAQETVIVEIEKMDDEKDFRKILDSCTKYIPENFSVPVFKAKLLGYKANALSKINDSTIEAKENQGLDIERDSVAIFLIDSFYHAAAKACSDCDLAYISRCYEYCERFTLEKASDYELLKAHGFKKQVEAIWINPDFFHGNNDWIGAEISVGMHQSAYKLRKKVNGKNKIFDEMSQFSASVFNLGFRKSVNGKGYGINFSPVSVSYFWINLRPANFLYLKNESSSSLGYCPEAGIHFWYVYVHAGYNWAFRNSMRNYEKLLLNFKIEFPLWKINQ